MSYQTEYRKWLESPALDKAQRAELAAIEGNEAEIEDRFYAPLAFGTAGLRGVLGMGTNRMNVFVVRQATQAIANMICSLGEDAKKQGVAIAYDPRTGLLDPFHGADELQAGILRAVGIPFPMFPVMYAIARSAGWAANWMEFLEDSDRRIDRPRQLYTGSSQRSVKPIFDR